MMHENVYETGSTKQTVLASVKRRWAIAALTAAIVFAASMYVLFGLKPMYASKTTLILPFTPVAELTSRNDNSSSPQSDPLIVHSYTQIIQDDGICLQIIRQLKLVDKPEFDPAPSALLRTLQLWATPFLGREDSAKAAVAMAKQDRVLQAYKKRLKVYNDGRSLAVDLSFQAEDRDLAAAIANAHAEAYIAAQVRYRRAEAETKTAWMEEQVAQSAEDLKAAQMALQLRRPSVATASAFAAEDSADFKFRQTILNSKQAVYQSLLNREQIMLAEQHYDGSDTRILSPARPAIRPAFPNKPLLGAVALMISILAGAAIAWGTDIVLRSRQYTAARLSELRLDQIAFIEIPRTWAFPFKPQLRKLRLALYWEKIRGIRGALGCWQNKGIVLAVTSADPKGTPSLIAASLARAIAASGVRTLLVDLDLRTPIAHKYLDMEVLDGHGLAECLDGEVALKQAVRPATKISPVLSLLSGSTRPERDVDMLAGAKIREKLVELRRQYKAIIIDTPPIGVVYDSLVVSDLADQVVIVADEGQQAMERLGKAVAELRRSSIIIRGVVVSSRRVASAASCRALIGYVTNDKLSEVPPLPPRKKKMQKEAEISSDIGVLHPAE